MENQLKWFGYEVNYESLNGSASPASVFGVMRLLHEEPKKLLLKDRYAVNFALGANIGFDFSTQDLDDAAKVYEFCKANNFSFFVNLAKKPYELSSFSSLRVFDFHKLKHGFVASIGNDRWVEIGQYNTLRALDSNENTVDYGEGATYARIVLSNRAVPHIQLDAKDRGAKNKGNLISDSLEGNFHTLFNVQVAQGFQSDLRYILTPDVMEVIMTDFPDTDIEIAHGCLFLLMPYTNYLEAEKMQDLLERIQRITKLVENRLVRYANDKIIPESVEENSYEKMLKLDRS